MTPLLQEPVHVEPLEQGAYWRVVLAGSKGNIIDIEMLEALTDVFRKAGGTPALKAICLEG